MSTQILALTKEVDYALIVCCKKSDGIFEQKHEGCIDDTICQLIGINLKEKREMLITISLKSNGKQKCRVHTYIYLYL